MIVVDTNVIASLLLPNDGSAFARRLLTRDPEWAAPVLWRSELRNVLANWMRKRSLGLVDAGEIQAEAESLLADAEHEVPSIDVLRLVNGSDCSAYDCEFVALAMRLGTRLVTRDTQVLRNFPDVAVSLVDAAGHDA